MRKLFAVPTIDQKLCAHFGHCQQFAIVETDGSQVLNVKYLNPPEHQPGTYPRFLASHQVNVIIAGGMGGRAKQLFDANNIEVYMGINAENPKTLVEQYLNDQLVSGDNQCDHDGEDHDHDHNHDHGHDHNHVH